MIKTLASVVWYSANHGALSLSLLVVRRFSHFNNGSARENLAEEVRIASSTTISGDRSAGVPRFSLFLCKGSFKD